MASFGSANWSNRIAPRPDNGRQKQILYSAFDILTALASAFPPRAALAAGRGLGIIIGTVLRYRRRDADRALQCAFSQMSADERRRILRAMYRHLGCNVIEMLRLEKAGRAYLMSHIEWRGREHLDAALAEGRGVLMLSAHTGNWELGITALPALGYPASVVVKRIRSSAVNAGIERVRRQFGLQLLPSQGAYRDCLRALRRNEVLGFVLDQNRTIYDGIFVEFFGLPACTSPGLAHMAATSGAPVVPVFMERIADDRHCFNVSPSLEPPADRTAAALAEATQRYCRVIEDFVRRHPEQWIWIHRRWKTQPRGSAGAGSVVRANLSRNKASE